MRFKHLDDWLSWQETLNPAEIELGLARITRVLNQANLTNPFTCPLITVAGTNGKGSVVAILEAIAMSADLKVCSYTSPHIFHYNERIKCNVKTISDADLCAAFEHIDQARGDERVTYFEFGTLAAIDWISKQNPDLVIMEVGLGGRLDAVNILDSDVSILTSIAIDHVDWLGDDREKIGFEKAGVFRKGKTVICGEYDPPKSVIEQAGKLHCKFIQIGRDYRVVDGEFDNETGSEIAREIASEINNETGSKIENENNWSLKSCFYDIDGLPLPALLGEFQKSNAATAIVALQALQQIKLLPSLSDETPLSTFLPQALQNIILPGRFQKIHSQPSVYVDVAHNPHAALSLASQLKSSSVKSHQPEDKGETWAIVAMLSDKDVAGVLENTWQEIDHWCFAGLESVARGLPVLDFLAALPAAVLDNLAVNKFDFDQSNLTKLKHDLAKNQCTILADTIMLAKSVTQACQSVLSKAKKHDRVIIFGSFYTVADAMRFFSELNRDIYPDTERLKK